MAQYTPQRMLREVAVDPGQAALLFIDVQNFNCHRRGAMYRSYTMQELEGPEFAYFWARVDDCMGKWQQLQQAARNSGMEVMYTVIQSLTADGRDRSLDHKISGFHVPPGCWDAQVVDAITPMPDDIVLPKTSSSVFSSTCLDYLLRNMDKRFLLIVGCMTDSCVSHAVKDAADKGYLVTLVTDCCATYSADRHISACQALSSYCRQRTLDDILTELSAIQNTSPLQGASPEAIAPMLLCLGADITGGTAGADSAAAAAAGVPLGHLGPQMVPVTSAADVAGVADAAAAAAAAAGLAVGDGGYVDHQAAGIDNGGAVGQGYQRVCAGIMYSSGDGMDMETYSGDNFSPGLLQAEQSDGDEEEELEGGGATTSGGSKGRARGGRARTRRGTAATGSGDNKKPLYFEYAKMQWEKEEEFLLPNGITWVIVAVKGEPKTQERGVVFCKLCRHYNKSNVFGKGYRAGKRSALKEHMATKDHKELVEALEAGVIAMPPDHMDEQMPIAAVADPDQGAAAAAAFAALNPTRKRGRGRPSNTEKAARLQWEHTQELLLQQQQQQQQLDALPHGALAAAAAAGDPLASAGLGADQLLQQYSYSQMYAQEQYGQQQQQYDSQAGYAAAAAAAHARQQQHAELPSIAAALASLQGGAPIHSSSSVMPPVSAALLPVSMPYAAQELRTAAHTPRGDADVYQQQYSAAGQQQQQQQQYVNTATAPGSSQQQYDGKDPIPLAQGRQYSPAEEAAAAAAATTAQYSQRDPVGFVSQLQLTPAICVLIPGSTACDQDGAQKSPAADIGPASAKTRTKDTREMNRPGAAAGKVTSIATTAAPAAAATAATAAVSGGSRLSEQDMSALIAAAAAACSDSEPVSQAALLTVLQQAAAHADFDPAKLPEALAELAASKSIGQ